MRHRSICGHCGSQDTFQYPKAYSSHTLLPGLINPFKSDGLEVVACARCGHIAFFVARKYLDRLREKWQRVISG